MEKQILEVRIIGDTGKFIDKEFEFEPIEYNNRTELTLVTYPTPEEIEHIHAEVCGVPDCTCEKHQYYRMRDIYKDGNVRLEIFMERVRN